jgi:hypothetical protein
MNKKFFSLFFIIGFPIWLFNGRNADVPNIQAYHSVGVKPNDTKLVRQVSDSLKSVLAGEFSGKDSSFVKGRKAAVGYALCPTLKTKAGGDMVILSYKVHKKRGKLVTTTGNLSVWSYAKQKGLVSIKVMSSIAEVRGAKIVFSLGAVDPISREGKSWGALTKVEGTYDTSNGKYSIKIRQLIPDTAMVSH